MFESSTSMFEAPVNVNTLNDFSNSINPNDAFAAPISGDRVLLFVFSPHLMPSQVLRSYQYSFTPDFVDELSRKQPVTGSFENLVGAYNLRNIPGGMTAILPSGDGKIADVSNWSGSWTFTLIIDIQQTMFNGIIAPGMRKVASGYFVGEPGFQSVGSTEFIINPDAILVFTKVNTVNVRRTYMPNSTNTDGFAMYPTSMDYASEVIPMLYKEEMYLGTPQDLLCEQLNTPTGMADYRDISLSNAKDGSAVKTINSEMRIPTAQLGNIMRAIDSGVTTIEAGNGIHDRLSTSQDEYLAPVDHALNTVANNLASYSVIDAISGIDTSKPITLRELDAKFPFMRVLPQKHLSYDVFGWDIAEQVGMGNNGVCGAIVSPRQQFSSLATSVCSAACSLMGISTIAFSYRWVDTNGFMTGKFESFYVHPTPVPGLIVPRPDRKAVIEKFKNYLDFHLFEVIHSCCGEFEMHALCDSASTNLVNLVLYWYPDDKDNYFQTDSKLGGIVNPNVGSLDTVNSNALALSDLSRDLIGRQFAVQDFPTSANYA